MGECCGRRWMAGRGYCATVPLCHRFAGAIGWDFFLFQTLPLLHPARPSAIIRVHPKRHFSQTGAVSVATIALAPHRSQAEQAQRVSHS